MLPSSFINILSWEKTVCHLHLFSATGEVVDLCHISAQLPVFQSYAPVGIPYTKPFCFFGYPCQTFSDHFQFYYPLLEMWRKELYILINIQSTIDWYWARCGTMFSVLLLIFPNIWFILLSKREHCADIFIEIFIRTRRSQLWVENQSIYIAFFPCAQLHTTTKNLICCFITQSVL